MKILSTLLLTFIVSNAGAIASDALNALDHQIIAVKKYLGSIPHPRLVLGVANTPEKNGNPGPNPFLDNPNDILANEAQGSGVLESRSLTLNFNDIASLKKLAENFQDSFDVITADYLVTKYTKWTKDHLAAFKKMLKPGGKLIVPIDPNFNSVTFAAGKTKQELFENANADTKISTDDTLYIWTKVMFQNLPGDMLFSLPPEVETKIQTTIEEFKNLRPTLDFSTPEAKRKGRQELMAKGLFPIEEEILKDGNKLARVVRNQLLAPEKSKLVGPLSDEFMEHYVIPNNIKRIAGAVFDPAKITVKKGLALPQPHRDLTYQGYSFEAIK